MAGDTLAAFFWRGRWLRVESVEKVERRRSWWELPPGDTCRVKVQGGGLYDLVRAREGCNSAHLISSTLLWAANFSFET